MDDRLESPWQLKPIDDASKSIEAFLAELSRQSLDAVEWDGMVAAVDSKFVKFLLVTNGVTTFRAKQQPYLIESVMVAFLLEVTEFPLLSEVVEFPSKR